MFAFLGVRFSCHNLNSHSGSRNEGVNPKIVRLSQKPAVRVTADQSPADTWTHRRPWRDIVACEHVAPLIGQPERGTNTIGSATMAVYRALSWFRDLFMITFFDRVPHWQIARSYCEHLTNYVATQRSYRRFNRLQVLLAVVDWRWMMPWGYSLCQSGIDGD